MAGLQYTLEHRRPGYGCREEEILGRWQVEAAFFSDALEEAQRVIRLKEGEYLLWRHRATQ